MSKLNSFREAIAATMKPCIEITPVSSDKIDIRASKFGGLPYCPVKLDYPNSLKVNLGRGKRDLHLLAQFNFEEIPPHPDFPDRGILQFFVLHNDWYGEEFSDYQSYIAPPLGMAKIPNRPWFHFCPQDTFRVVYHPDPNLKCRTRFSDWVSSPLGIFKRDCQFQLAFELKEEPISIDDYRFSQTLGIEKYSDLCWEYAEEYKGCGHKLGGYPNFCQDDPRQNDLIKDNLILLFQMLSDYSASILWGDVGSAQFLIRKEDLLNLDFSRILYFWSCS